MSVNKIIIEPGSASNNYWRDIWDCRGLLYFLAWRDVLVRYKQTFIGIAWSVLRPLLTMFAMAFVGWLFNASVADGVPRLVLVCSATLPWQFFSSAFSDSAGSLISNSNLLTKVYFPRMIVPVSTVLVCLIDFFISLAILFFVMLFYRFVPDIRILLLPVFIMLTLITALGSGLFIAALNVKYRDFRYIVPFIVQFGLYITPVAFSSTDIFENDRIGPAWKFIYSLNPMVSVIDGFRWCIIGEGAPVYVQAFVVSLAFSVAMLFLGIWYFRKTERNFADII
ncbi:MAG: ABC transporter permease [Crocinitomicaceae bacterium]|nr:ABC transporter permease [Crocinitomicaceae bacterium]